MTYVRDLDADKQKAIAKEIRDFLVAEGRVKPEELEQEVQNAMDSKLRDLEELINVRKYL